MANFECRGLSKRFGPVQALEGVDIWLARWRSLDQGPGYNGPGNLTMWQYTDSGRVDGISGNVDRNVSYKNYR